MHLLQYLQKYNNYAIIVKYMKQTSLLHLPDDKRHLLNAAVLWVIFAGVCVVLANVMAAGA